MAILDSPLMGEFIQFLKSNWGTNSRVSQRRRRLRQLVAMVRGVADAAEDRAALRGGSLNAWLQQLRMVALRGQAVLDATTDATAVAGAARMLLAGVRMMFVCSAEVDRLAQAVDELERLAGPGGDLDLFVKVLQLDAAAAAMDIDGEEGVGISWVRSANSSPAILPNPGEKRKRGGISSIVDGDGDGESSRRSTPEMTEWQRKRQRKLLPGLNPLAGAARRATVARRRGAETRASALTVAMEMVRVRRGIAKSRRRRGGGSTALIVGLSTISLQ